MPEPIGPSRVVTFYSYKGGVGRTLALVNTAHVLALEGWRVLMVDFDLEAPGMTHFFAREVRRRPTHVRKVSLDLLLDARCSLAAADSSGKQPEYPRSLAEYVVPLSLPPAGKEELPKGIPYRNGRLDLIPATLEPRRAGAPPAEEPPPDYVERLRELDLASLFETGGPGHLFGDHVRNHFLGARFEAPGDILFALRDPVTAAYDVVLIDSRTGLNEIAGFSIGTVADALVICCGLNQQNIEGTRYFMKKTGLFNRKAKRFVMAVGPVPPWRTSEVDERLRVLRRALHLRQDTRQPFEDLPDLLEGAKEGSFEIAYDYPDMVEIPYHPLAAVREIVFVNEFPRDSIAQAYVRLASRIRSKLLPGALEGVERDLLIRNLLLNPAPKVLRHYCEAAARQLPQLRLLRNQAAPIPASPTIEGVTSLPEGRREIRWEDLGRIAVAAAVASHYTRSAAPFERAWALLSTLQDEGHRRFLACCLIYFQSPTPNLPPKEALSSLTSPPQENQRGDQRLLRDLCIFLAGLRLISYHPGSFEIQGKRHDILESALWSLLTRPRRSILSPWRWSAGRYPVPEAVPLLLRIVERLASGTLREDAEAMTFLKKFYQLPATPGDILHGKVEFPKLGHSMLEITVDRSAYSNTPIGFWPEPLAATVLAAADGPEAIEEILAWIHLARLHYGYAWRVLLDWRYFDEVKTHPRFEAFLREEDQVVATIEARIDRGELPL